MTSIVEVIQHYQRSIDSSQDNEGRLLHCINKLYNLPIKVEHLQETGVGKTVNSLRKFNGEIGIAAKTLVTKWKAMVAAEEEPMDTTSQTNDSETHENNNDDGGGATPQDDDDEDNENHNLHNTSPQEQNKHASKEKDKHRERHKERSSSSNGHKESRHSSSHHHSEKTSKNSIDKLKSSSSSSKDKASSHHKSSSSKDKEREKEKTEHKNNKDKHRDKDHDKDRDRSDRRKEDKHKDDRESSSSHHKSSSSSSSKTKHDDKHQASSKEKDKERSEKHKSSSKDKERTKEEKPSSKEKSEHKSSSSKSSTKDSSETAERKRRHNSDNESNDFKSPQPKLAKLQKSSSTASSSSKLESKPENSPPLAAEDEEVTDDSFDSSMGTNFNDILGMLDVPKKKSKKSIKSSPSIANNSSSNSRKETTPNRPSTSSSSNNTPTKVNGVRTPFASSSSSYSAANTSKVTQKPDLLAPTAKLEPLDPSIALELPSISTNYKPMPLNQTVMDCVFNFSSSSNNSKPVRTLTDSEAITHGISSKTMRTKIYSGVRTGQTFQVPSLFDMCIRILQKNIDALEYTGGVPFEVLRPVLDRATPQQLYNFEEYNPYLMEDSDLLWQVHVSRNYRTKKRQENESWREMYMRCQEEEEEKLSMLKNNIKASQKIAAAPIRKTQLAFIDSMVKPPRNVQRKQEQYGTKSKMVATPASRVASLQSVTPNAAKTGDQRLKVPTAVRDPVHVNPVVRNKKAPLMQKTLQFIRGRLKR